MSICLTAHGQCGNDLYPLSFSGSLGVLVSTTIGWTKTLKLNAGLPMEEEGVLPPEPMSYILVVPPKL